MCCKIFLVLCSISLNQAQTVILKNYLQTNLNVAVGSGSRFRFFFFTLSKGAYEVVEIFGYRIAENSQ